MGINIDKLNISPSINMEVKKLKESNKFSKLIDDYIVTGIETLVDLTYYVNFMDNLLNKKHFRDLLGALAGYKE